MKAIPKSIIVVLTLIIFSANLFSQLPAAISISPADATGWDDITLTLDPSKACFQSGSLVGAASISLHSGYTNASCMEWQNVISNAVLGADGTSPALSDNGNGTWSITFCPGTYYGLTAGTEIKAINAVFNNGTDWTTDARDFDPEGNCMDFNIPLKTYSGEMFTELDVGFADGAAGVSSWGDYDNDGDMDLLLNKYGPKIYRNNGDKTFSDILAPIENSSGGVWIDFDGDRDLDVFSGTSIYENKGGDTFVASTVDDLKGYSISDIFSPHAADYDKDGDEDIIFAFRREIRLLNNMNGTFKLVHQEIEGKADVGNIFQRSHFKDIDNDGDFDILGGRVHKNNGYNLFTQDMTFPEDDQTYYMSLGDYGDDGDLDLIYYNSSTNVFLENTAGHYAEISHPYGTSNRFYLFGDVDNNGYTDMLTCSGNTVTIYFNDGTGNYISSTFSQSIYNPRSASLGDFDGDGDMDIAIYNDGTARILQNNLNRCNVTPSVPVNLAATISGNSVHFSWDRSTDEETPSAALSYNICLINTDVNDTIKLPRADLNSNILYDIYGGNTETNNFWDIRGLRAGNYKWTIQAIDNSYHASTFASYETFQINSSNYIPQISAQSLLPGQSGAALSIIETASPNSRIWAYSKFPSGPYDYELGGETSTSFTPVFDDDGLYYIICKSIVGSDTLISNEVFINVLPFTEDIVSEIDPDAWYGRCISGDYDNDGDLDLLFNGSEGVKIFKNSGGSYSELSITEYMNNGDLAWLDLNNDNKLDIIVTGENSGNNLTKIFVNEGSDSFSELSHDILGLIYGSVDVGDYDQDGDPDILICGMDSEPKTKIFRNEGSGVFADIEVPINQVMDGFARWGDYNNDGRLDIFMSGTDFNGNSFTGLYQNMGKDVFEKHSYPFEQIRFSFGGFGDYDNDNDLDILLGGRTNDGAKVFLYKNLGNEQFVEMIISEDKRYNYVRWLDYNNDGLLDILMLGNEWYSLSFADFSHVQLIYKNLGNDIFEKIAYEDIFKNEYQFQTIGDFDNDTDIDLFQFSFDGRINNRYSSLHYNNSSFVKPLPDAPGNLSNLRRGEQVVLNWEKPGNVKDEGITYDIIFGTHPDSMDIVAPLSQVETGYRLVAQSGPIIDTSYQVTIQDQGDYYWRVQAIDNSYKGSEFSLVDTITVGSYFVELANPFIQLRYDSDTDFGDYDNDGDKDLLISGKYSSDGWKSFCHIYENIGGGAFNPTPVWQIDQTQSLNQTNWVDLDNDNDLDFMIRNSEAAVIYENTGGGNFTERFTYNAYQWFSLGDYNHDGLIDFVMGSVFINNGDFTFTIESFPVSYRLISDMLYDFDNDNDLDMLTLNHNDYYVVSDNTGGAYNSVQLGELSFVGSYPNGIDVGDLNNDGLLDIIVTGYSSDDATNNTKIFKNEGNMVFTEVQTLVRGTTNGAVKLGDYDNDNDLDILLCGKSFSVITTIYANNGNFQFEEKQYGFIGAWQGTNNWSDFDNDGDLDVLYTGTAEGYAGQSKLFRNDLNIPAAQIYPPTDISAEQYGLGILLSWNDSLNKGVTYNVRVGTGADTYDIVSPMADMNTGSRKLSQEGNAGLTNEYILSYLPPGKYFWSVHAISAAYEGSTWSGIDSFLITDLVADFSADTVCLGIPTHFTDLSLTSLEGVNSWYWDFGEGGSSIEQHPQHSFSASGIFNVKLVVETNTYTDSITLAVEVKQVPVLDFTSNIVCDGQSTSFSNLSNISGLTISQWSWDFGDGATSPVQFPGSHGYLNAGDYIVELSALADNGCSDTTTNTATVGAIPAAGITVSGNPEFCEGDSVILSNEYISNYLYQWKIYGSNLSGADSSKYVAKTTGDYAIEVTNPIGYCSDISDLLVVTANTAPSAPIISIVGSTTFCDGDSVELSVAFSADFTYFWKRNGGAVGANSNTYYALEDGNFTVDVTNSTGCLVSSSNSVTVTVNAAPVIPTVSVSGNTTFCDGNMVNLSVTNEPLMNYQWMNGIATIGGATTSSFDADATGDYKLSITNPTGCKGETVPVSVIVNPTPASPTISLSDSDEFCAGGSVTLSAAEDVSLTYLWKKDGGATGSNQNTHLVSLSGDYTLEVSNTYNCVSTADNTATITVNANPTVPTVNVSGATTICDDETLNLSVTNDPLMTYQWYNGVVTVGGAITNSLDPDVTGDYKLNLKDGNGCISETTPTSVTVNPTPASPTISESGLTTFCDVDSVILSVTDDATLNYQWQLNGGSVGTDISSYEVRTGGDYTVEVSNTYLCSAISNTVVVTVYTSPIIPTVGINGDTAFCEGQSVELSVTNDGTMSYQWKDGDLNVGGATSNSYTASSTGAYKLNITNGDGCVVETKVVSVIADPAPTAPTIGYTGSLEFCDTESVILSVTDNPNYTYEWLLNGGTVGTSSSSYTASATGDYKVKVQNLGDCFTESVNTVSLLVHASPASPTLNLSGPTTFCNDTSVMLSVSDPGTDSYQWISGLGEMIDKTSTSITIDETGLYKVRVRNTGLCDAFSQEIAVTVNAYPTIPVIITENYALDECQEEDPVTLSVQTVEAGTVYQWNRNGVSMEGKTNSTLTGYLEEGDYSVEAMSNTCGVESQILTIRYGEMPDKPTILAEGPTIWYLACSNDSATAYKWYLDGTQIEGADEYLYVAGTQEGKFEVAISENSSCFAKSDPLWIPLGTGIEVDPWENLKIYPNPTPGLFTLEMDNHIMGELIIDIFGETGSKIINIKFQKETAHFKTQIDLSEQPPAAYLIGLMLDKYRTNRTLVVE